MAVVESISAVTLVVTDMARSLAFYETLGFETISGGVAQGFTSLRAGHQFLNLSAEPGSPGIGWGRVIFHVNDVDAFHRRAQARGLEADFAPRDAVWGERYFHIADPDGHELSFARPL